MSIVTRRRDVIRNEAPQFVIPFATKGERQQLTAFHRIGGPPRLKSIPLVEDEHARRITHDQRRSIYRTRLTWRKVACRRCEILKFDARPSEGYAVIRQRTTRSASA